MKRITIKELAIITGHSKSTVSNALNGKGGVSDKEREKILSKARELGYFPNALARKMSSGNYRTVGIILRNIGSPFYSDIFDIVDSVSKEHDYQILFYNLRDEEKNLSTALDFMRGQQVDGIILDSFGNNEEINKSIIESKIPTVIFGLNVIEDISCVQADDEGASRDAVDYAVSKGYKNIYFLSQGNNSYYEVRRLNAIKERVLFNGLPFDDHHFIHQEDISILVKEVIKSCPKNSLLMCYNDMFACRVISELMKHEKYVPKDYSIIGFDNISIIPYSLTTIEIPSKKMGEVAIKHLFDLIENEGAKKKKITLKAKLIIRDSVKDLT